MPDPDPIPPDAPEPAPVPPADPPPNPRAKPHVAPRFPKGRNASWTHAFGLFCEGFSFASIAAQMGVSNETVSRAAHRMDWLAKRTRLAEEYPAIANATPTGLSPVALQLIGWQEAELEKLDRREAKLDKRFARARGLEALVELNKSLLGIFEARMQVLRIPKASCNPVRGPAGPGRPKRVSGTDQPITDVAPPRDQVG